MERLNPRLAEHVKRAIQERIDEQTKADGAATGETESKTRPTAPVE
jgi:hypothetical protein